MNKGLNIRQAKKMPIGTKFIVNFIGETNNIAILKEDGILYFNDYDCYTENNLKKAIFYPIGEPIPCVNAMKEITNGVNIFNITNGVINIYNATVYYFEGFQHMSAYEIIDGVWYAELKHD